MENDKVYKDGLVYDANGNVVGAYVIGQTHNLTGKTQIKEILSQIEIDFDKEDFSDLNKDETIKSVFENKLIC